MALNLSLQLFNILTDVHNYLEELSKNILELALLHAEIQVEEDEL